MMRLRPLAALVVIALLAAGCGGGGSSVPSIAPTAVGGGGASSTSNGRTARISGVVHIPAPPKLSTARRRIQYVSPATNSLVYKQGAYFTVIPVAAGAAGCITAADGSRTCSFTASATPGTNVAYTVSTFQSADGSGTPLSIATMTMTILPDTANTLSLTLSPVVSTLGVAITGTAFTPGAKATQTVVVTAKDGAGDTIATGTVGLVDASGNPVTVALTDADKTGSTSLSPTTLTTTSTSTLTYSGSGDPTQFTITANATSSSGTAVLATANASFVFTIPESLYILDGGNARIVEYGLAADGSLAANAAPRRIIDISTASVPNPTMNCSDIYGGSGGDVAIGIAVDQQANIFVALNCYIADNNNVAQFYFLQYGPGSTTTGPVLQTVLSGGASPEITLDPNRSTSSTDVLVSNDSAGDVSFSSASMIDSVSITPVTKANTATPTQAQLTFVDLSGLPTDSASTATDFYPPIQPLGVSGSLLFANGSLVMNGTLASPVVYNGIFSVASTSTNSASTLTPPNAIAAGLNTELGYNDGQGEDGFATAGTRLYMLLNGSQTYSMASELPNNQGISYTGSAALGFCNAAFSTEPATSLCTDGFAHDTLVAFDTSVFTGASPTDAAKGVESPSPLFAIGAAPANTVGMGCGAFHSNTIAAYQSKIYIANPSGANCTAYENNELGTKPYPSELDIYDVSTISGPSNTLVPTVIKDPNGNFAPIAVAVGPSGSVTTTTALSAIRTDLRPLRQVIWRGRQTRQNMGLKMILQRAESPRSLRQ